MAKALPPYSFMLPQIDKTRISPLLWRHSWTDWNRRYKDNETATTTTASSPKSVSQQQMHTIVVLSIALFLVVTYNCYIKRQMQRGHLKQKESKRMREKRQHILRVRISTKIGDFNIPVNWNGLPSYSKWFSKCNCCCRCCFDAISECF